MAVSAVVKFTPQDAPALYLGGIQGTQYSGEREHVVVAFEGQDVGGYLLPEGQEVLPLGR